MKEATELEKQQYQKMIKLSDLARKRYLEAGGEPRCAADDKYMTDEERKEFLALGRIVFGVQIREGEVSCQGQTWKVAVSSEK